MRLLVTRPQPDAARTAQTLCARGHEVLVAPLLHMEIVERNRLEGGAWAGVLITSVNAIRALSAGERTVLRGLSLLAVGERTAAEARENGFADVRSAGGDARNLARMAAQVFHGATAPVLYLAGEARAHDLAAALAAQRIEVTTIVIYRMRVAARFPPEARDALAAGRIDGVIHYSQRTAEAYLACANADGIRDPSLRPAQFCLSQAIAERLTAAGAADVRHGENPSETALLRLLDF